MSPLRRRPDPTEYAEYYHRYVERVPDGDIVRTLEEECAETCALLAATPSDKETFRYAPGKWSVRESLGHVIDAERVFAGRALWIARTPSTGLPSMEQDDWALASNAGSRSLADLLEEWRAVRAATVEFFRGLDEVQMAAAGIASDVRFTVRSFPWIIAGHELHHRMLFRDAYNLNRTNGTN